MDILTAFIVVVVALLVLGAAAAVFGQDSRDSFDDVTRPTAPGI